MLLYFIGTLLITVLTVTIAMAYLRQATRGVIVELCESDAGAEFWLRSADILAYSGCLLLVLLFTKSTSSTDWLEAVRTTLILTLAGLFTTILFVAQNVWATVKRNNVEPPNQG